MGTVSGTMFRGSALGVAAYLLAACGAAPGGEAGVLRLATEPGGAEIRIDGQPHGVSPQGPDETLAIRLPSAEYAIEALRVVDEHVEYHGAQTYRFDASQPQPPLRLVLERRLTAAGQAREQAEAQRLANLEQTALARFAARDDGTVLEAGAGLLWMRCSLGQQWNGAACTGEAQRFSWHQAHKAAGEAGFAGHADWRLPTQPELYALVHCSSGMRRQLGRDGTGGGCAGSHRSPTILPAVFPDTPVGNFWTSTPHEQFPYSAWGVSFNTGNTGTGARNDYVHVRLVRDAR